MPRTTKTQTVFASSNTALVAAGNYGEILDVVVQGAAGSGATLFSGDPAGDGVAILSTGIVGSPAATSNMSLGPYTDPESRPNYDDGLFLQIIGTPGRVTVNYLG